MAAVKGKKMSSRKLYVMNSLCVLLVAWGLTAAGCAKDLTPSGEQPTADGGNGPPPTRKIPGEKIQTKDLGAGVTQVIVNSSDEESWIYFSFSTGEQVMPAEPATSSAWDIAFQRFKVKSNGGVSGAGGVMVALLDDAAFDEVEAAPVDGYIVDEKDGDDENKDPDAVFLVKEAWFKYNVRDHTLAPRERIYVIKGVEGQYYKLEFLKYYDDKGNSGFPTFRWAKIDPPK